MNISELSFLKNQLRLRALIRLPASVSAKSQYRDFLYIGRYSKISNGCWIINTKIGNFSIIEQKCQIGKNRPFVHLFSNHQFALGESFSSDDDDEFYRSLKTTRFFYEKNPITMIGNDVRICENTIVYSGVNISDGAYIYPYSVVDEDVPPYAIAAGNPARVIGFRFPSNIINELLKSNWTDRALKSLTENAPQNRINYLNIDRILSNLSKQNTGLISDDVIEIDSLRKIAQKMEYDCVVIGPSHISNWYNCIREKSVPEVPFYLFGAPGLSLGSKTTLRAVDFFVKLLGFTVVLFVPDFRIGNASLLNNQNAGNGLFIDPELLNYELDLRSYNKNCQILSDLTAKYGNKIKFIFWCLYGRERTNIRNRKYIYNDLYHHPIWNYKTLKEKYNKNIIDISELGEEIFELIEDDGSIHPTTTGYNYLSKKIKEAL